MHGLSIYLKRQRNQFLSLEWSFYPCSVSYLLLAFWAFTIYTMATKVKGIYKYITNIFVCKFTVVNKERELEIGCPTDVKHVAHIGWEGPSGGAPTWMKTFKAGPEFAATSFGNSGSAISSWSSQGCGESTRQLTTGNIYKGISTSDVASPPKKHRRRKPKSTTSSPKSSSPSALRSSRATKHKAKVVEGNNSPTAIEVS
ncbi:CRIB domain-containing protein RIC10-like [Capsicum chacoense]